MPRRSRKATAMAKGKVSPKTIVAAFAGGRDGSSGRDSVGCDGRVQPSRACDGDHGSCHVDRYGRRRVARGAGRGCRSGARAVAMWDHISPKRLLDHGRAPVDGQLRAGRRSPRGRAKGPASFNA